MIRYRQKLFNIALLGLLLVLASHLPAVAQSAEVTIAGVLTDSISGQPIEFANIAQAGTTNGTTTDETGHFELSVRAGSTLTVSCLGYAKRELRVTRSTHSLTLRLLPTDIQLAEVVVKRKSEHYRRKDNPAVAFMRQVISHKNDSRPLALDHYSCQRYEQTLYALNNFSAKYQQSLRKRFKFIDKYIDTLNVTGRPMLPVSLDERISSQFFRRRGQEQREVLEAQFHDGVDEMLPPEIMSLLKTNMLQEVELCDDNIYLFNQHFLSPLSEQGITFYKYYLLDTLHTEGQSPLIDIGFAPYVPHTYGFVGHLFVEADSTFMVRKALLEFPPDLNMNFARNLHVTLLNSRLPDGTVVTADQCIDVDLNNTNNGLGIHARRAFAYSGFSSLPLADSLFLLEPISDSPQLAAQSLDQQYWSLHRAAYDFDPERSVGAMLAEMRQVPFYKYMELSLTTLFKGFIPLDALREERAHVLFGRVNSIASWNALEHARLRVGGMTTGNISHYLFGQGYAAYGIGDHKWKYDAQLEYSFRRKKLFAEEFPVRSLRLESTYDSKELGSVMVTNRDNFINSMRRDTDPKFTYRWENSLTYTYECWNHFSFVLQGEWMREYESRLARFDLVGGERKMSHDLAFGTVSLRWAPKEVFAQTHTGRIRMDFQHPVFELTHRFAKKGVLGTDFDYQATDFMFQKRIWHTPFGFTDMTLRAGKVWTQVPYTHLAIPRTNAGFYLLDDCFTQLESMEFVYDQYATWNLAYNMNGLILNQIPYLRKLRWREIVCFRGFVGSLSDKNNPDALCDDGSYRNPQLYRFPSNGHTYAPGSTPYMEVAFGIDNIFKCLRIDYIRRLSYLDHPSISKHGLQMVVSMAF